tara:strand:+ start:1027 stop:1395 length:369 start_codon:yes stop_codon:yes gene_type:complete
MADSAFGAGADEMPFLRDYLIRQITEKGDMTEEDADELINYCRVYGVPTPKLLNIINAGEAKAKLILWRRARMRNAAKAACSEIQLQNRRRRAAEQDAKRRKLAAGSNGLMPSLAQPWAMLA